MKKLSSAPEREYMWDNMKGILIFLVVVGHFLEGNRVTLPFAVDFDFWIYTFHMPAFIFVSGFWAKNYCKNGNVKGQKVGVLTAYYLIFQLLIMAYKAAIGLEDTNVSLFDSERGLWYIFTLILLYLMLPVVEKLPSWITVTAYFVLGLWMGREYLSGHYFSIQRTFVFAPFFFAGYYTSFDAVKKLRELKAYLRYPIGVLCVVGSILMWSINRELYPRQLFYGKATYEFFEWGIVEGSLMRLGAYAIASLMIIAMILILPKVKTFLSYLGKQSLQVYIFHLPIIILMFDTENFDFVRIDTWEQFGLLMLAAVAVTFFLSNPLLSYPFKWIQMLVNLLYSLKKQPEQIPDKKGKLKHGK